jgi:cation transport regulator ChaC
MFEKKKHRWNREFLMNLTFFYYTFFVQFVMFLHKSVMNFSKYVMNLSDLLYAFSKKKCNFAREIKNAHGKSGATINRNHLKININNATFKNQI